MSTDTRERIISGNRGTLLTRDYDGKNHYIFVPEWTVVIIEIKTTNKLHLIDGTCIDTEVRYEKKWHAVCRIFFNDLRIITDNFTHSIHAHFPIAASVFEGKMIITDLSNPSESGSGSTLINFVGDGELLHKENGNGPGNKDRSKTVCGPDQKENITGGTTPGH